MIGNLTNAEKLIYEKKRSKMIENLELKIMNGLGLEVRIFNLSHQMRYEAKVDFGVHFKSMSKLIP